MLWPPHVKSWLIGKDCDAGRDWGQEEKGTTEDEMAGWHHWLDGRESEWIPGVGDGQGGLACCDSWGHNESDTTERLNWTELNWDNWFWWYNLDIVSVVLMLDENMYFPSKKQKCMLINISSSDSNSKISILQRSIHVRHLKKEYFLKLFKLLSNI